MTADTVLSADSRPNDDPTETDWSWLGRCVADPEGFLGTTWSVQPYFEPGPESRFTGLFSVRELDQLMAMRVLRNTPDWPTRVRMVKGGASMPSHAFSKSLRTIAKQGTVVDCQSVAGLIRMGGTLLIEGIDQVAPGLFELCAGLESELTHHVGANAYLTPARSQGHNPHYDTHDVMILQISGTKHWRVFDYHPEASKKPEIVTTATAAPPAVDTLLTPGDVLYIPEGWSHVADTADDFSLHITVGFEQASRYDLLRYALSTLALRPPLHKRLPAGFAKNPPDLAAALAEAAHFLAAALSDSGSAARLIEDFTRSWEKQETRDPAGLIAESVSEPQEK